MQGFRDGRNIFSKDHPAATLFHGHSGFTGRISAHSDLGFFTNISLECGADGHVAYALSVCSPALLGYPPPPPFSSKCWGKPLLLLRLQSIHVIPYLNDLLIFAGNDFFRRQSSHLLNLGWLINEKSSRVPDQVKTFLGCVGLQGLAYITARGENSEGDGSGAGASDTGPTISSALYVSVWSHDSFNSRGPVGPV